MTVRFGRVLLAALFVHLTVGISGQLLGVNVSSSRDVVVATQSQQWPGATLSFVIDITGSMFDDLLQVRNGVQNIFEAISEQQDIPVLNYALVTFHDPGKIRLVHAV